MAAIHYLQHVPFEGLGSFAGWAASRGVEVQRHNAYEADFPDPDTIQHLIILGGPMGVNDGADHAWIEQEKAFLHACHAKGVRMLGICLGAQFLADMLGAPVYQGSGREIGWFPLALDASAGLPASVFHGFPKYFPVIHWHGETFDLPAGTQRLASSAQYANQAFQTADQQVLGLQFHLELEEENLMHLAAACASELEAGQLHVQTAEQMLADPGRFASLRQQAWQFMDNWYQTT